MNSVHFKSLSNEWTTPQDFYDKLHAEFKFTLDPCCTKHSAKCRKFYTKDDDGLSKSWKGETVFINPPYRRGIKYWIKKAYEESLNPDTTVVCLIPARTDTRYWHEFIFGKAKDIRFIKGRLKFGDSKNAAPFPSAVIIF